MRANDGTVAWHNGGNDSSYGELTRLQDDGAMVFWITNQHKNKAGGWDFYQLGPELTHGIAERGRRRYAKERARKRARA